MGDLYKYGIMCLDEGVRVFSDYRETPPTTCPHDTSHRVDVEDVSIFDSTKKKLVVVDQGGSKNRYFRSHGYTIPVKGGDNELSIRTSYITVPQSFTILPTVNNIGDLFGIVCDLGYRGEVVVDVPSGSTNIEFKSGDRVTYGMEVEFYIKDVLIHSSECIAIDYEKMIMTLDIPTPQDLPTGTMIIFKIVVMSDIPIVNSNNIIVGSNNITSLDVPSGSSYTIKYRNRTSDKYFSYVIEYRYG